MPADDIDQLLFFITGMQYVTRMMPGKTKKSVILMFLVATVLSSGWGQRAPVFHAQSRLVQVAVTVLGPKGQYVRGLTRKDFRLEVDGRPVEIEGVDARKQLSPAQTEPQAAPLPPGVYSNQAETAAADRIVLLYDYNGIPLDDLMRLRLRLLHWFEHSMRPGQKVAVFALNGELEVLQPFTSDRAALEATLQGMVSFHFGGNRFETLQELAALDRMAGFTEGAGNQGGHGGLPNAASMEKRAMGMMGVLAESSSHGLQEEQNLREREHYYSTTDALQDLASVLDGVPGRKAVVWLTENSGLGALWNPKLGLRGNQLPLAFSRLNQADVALFPVDVRGLPSSPGWILNMENAAAETGGMALGNNNSIDGMLNRVIRMTSEGYVVSFVPPAPRKGHPFRRLKLTTPGRPVTLLYRRQYREPELARAGVDAKNFALSLRRLMVHPLEMGGVPLTVRTLPPGPMKKVPWPGLKHPVQARQHGFVLTVPYQSLLHPVPGADGYAFDFTCARVLVPLDQPGKLVVLRQNRFYVHTVTAAQKKMLAGHDAIYHSTIPVPAGQVYLVRVVVRDNLSGKMGSVSFRVDGREQETARK